MAWSYYRLLINWLILSRVFEIRLFDGAASFYNKTAQIKIITVTTRRKRELHWLKGKVHPKSKLI